MIWIVVGVGVSGRGRALHCLGPSDNDLFHDREVVSTTGLPLDMSE